MKVTIVMYHYVREVAASAFPGIKGLELAKFRKQVEHLVKNYEVITSTVLTDALDGKKLPENAALLTFDDGYLDHYTNVFPVLDAYGISGSFFAPARCILERAVLDVNKIHYVLASVSDTYQLVDWLNAAIKSRQSEWRLQAPEDYWSDIAKPNRFDPAEVIYVKRMLQRDLPEQLRSELTSQLFTEFVTTNERAFADTLYMSTDQIRTMVKHGMEFGSHGYEHYWMNSIDQTEQANQIDLSLEFLRSVGVQTDRWTMCYPYGGVNDGLIQVIKDRGCALGFTARPEIADLAADDRFLLPRLDTNDLKVD